MAKKFLTDSAVRALKVSGDKQIDYWDQNEQGLVLRISPSGRKAWVFMYRFGKRMRRLTFATFPELSLADARGRVQVEKGLLAGQSPVDPATQKKQRLEGTFADLAVAYIERYAKVSKASWKQDQRLVEKVFLPEWKNRKVESITKQEIVYVLGKIASKGAKHQANRAYSCLRRIFYWGINSGIIEINNPCAKLDEPGGKESPRDRVLTYEEVKRIWLALSNEPIHHGHYFKLLFLTAQRSGEVARLRWRDVDLDRRGWTIPGEFTKNGKSHFVPLSGPALTLLRELKLKQGATGSGWVFGNVKTASFIVSHKKAFLRVRKASAVDFRVHDLRRTASTYMPSLGTDRFIVERVLNHSDSKITAIYDRYSYEKEKRLALDQWATSIDSFLERTRNTSSSSGRLEAGV